MDTALFFYNITITAAFIFCAAMFLVMHSIHKEKTLFWIGMVFLSFIVDNLLIYMNEFLPGFGDVYSIGIIETLHAVIWPTVIIFLYRRTVISLWEEDLSKKEVVAWFFVFFVITGLAMININGFVGLIRELLFSGLAVGIFLQASVATKKRGGFPERKGMPRITSSFLMVSALLQGFTAIEGILSNLGLDLVAGRFIGLELLSIYFSAAGVIFLIELMQVSHQSADEAKATLSEEEVFSNFSSHYEMTKRERDILFHLIKGTSYAEICQAEHISIGTVKAHAHNIYGKVGVKNRVQLYNAFSEHSVDL